MERTAIYLRKSRTDIEAEARGEGETLAKHKKALLKFAKEKGLNIVRIREEIVSGESLLHRPEMQELLKEVERGEYTAVLCMDIDRLGRGNMQEQGLILNAFRETDTKIITPTKTYDLKDESDELMTEIQTLFARQELKIITRRMQRGRTQSVEAGNYIGTRPPYGYEIRKEGKSRWLVPHPEQSKIVQMIYEWYTHDDPNERMGASKIANQLNEMGFKSYTGIPWSDSSVLAILKNKVYIGRLQWKKKEYKKTATGRVVKSRVKAEVLDVKGKHEPLISQETWEKAQEILKGKYHVPYQLENGITNPLAGLVRCAKCKYSMIYRPYTTQPAHLMCYNKDCDCRSSKFEYVEKAVISGLKEWLRTYKLELSKHKREDKSDREVELKQMAVAALEKEMSELEVQRGRLHDFLERGIYSEEIYLERSQNLAARMEDNRRAMERARTELQDAMNREKQQNNIIPMVQNVIRLYERSKDPAKKNALLKSILVKVEYRKEKHQRNDDFNIELFPKL
jgi:DNA invertase Pin-like site-specific DNA recombinase